MNSNIKENLREKIESVADKAKELGEKMKEKFPNREHMSEIASSKPEETTSAVEGTDGDMDAEDEDDTQSGAV